MTSCKQSDKITLFYFNFLMCFPEENQYDLFKNNGLPLLIQTLTESQNDELNKAATFVLYNCKKISKFAVT